MSDFFTGMLLGIAIGFAIGLNIGIAIGRKQKSWSELTEEEKRIRMIAVGVGVILLIFSFLVGLWQYYSYTP